ncbi:hypothetical protein K402DRAFT_412345 [Aulographum hederae CBS 113979]|uniref:protein-tyrosine-phosphatase n=1 Tax=Aulographum hederae CBS 113979 TaxID=1176131 RepID=A0A6G1H1A2_9PEZI|nr:hypothetical protein K402DRAFT_412345 [Aulographum hederae CBS 113979]
MTTASPSHTPCVPPHHHHPSRQQRPTPGPRSSTSRTPASVGQSMPPRSTPLARTPAERITREQRQPSPNYFGLTVETSAGDGYPSSIGPHARANWSPPTSNVRSAAAASPRIVPLDQNPEYEAFRKQSENNTFNFANMNAFNSVPEKKVKLDSASASSPGLSRASNSLKSPNRERGNNDASSTHQRSPKRLLSSPVPSVFDRPRRNSPAGFTERDSEHAPHTAHFLTQQSQVRASLPPSAGFVPPSFQHRSETLPMESQASDAKDDGPQFVTPQHIINLLESCEEEILLLDLRVSTQYAHSHLVGALNLCIPTTLLKRPSFNVQKLLESFKDDEQKTKFERWRSSKYVITYDASSWQQKDALSAINTHKKFASEGYSGAQYIIKGGYEEFSKKFPAWVTSGGDLRMSPMSPSLTIDSSRPAVAPVIGGCYIPPTKNAANPFFGNIRQNMDLIGGVGQMALKLPSSFGKLIDNDIPVWLRIAAEEVNQGKLVSERFLHIEKREQKRMQEALSGNVVYGSPGPNAAKGVQIAGIEKGSKNRYNNIWPYEHSRVKLQGVSPHGCDYVNANHVKTAWSNKRYIATQGPIPTTFNDFWNVVWQQDVRCIVMLTAEKEGGQVKAHNYWESRSYGQIRLSFLSEHRASLEPSKIQRHRDRSSGARRSTVTSPSPSQQEHDLAAASPRGEQPFVIVRRFTLSHEGRPFDRMREITQLQYSNWPDFGAPAHPAHLLGLVEQCDAVVRSTNGSPTGPDPATTRPVLVHCSAGCGRTGTFCTVDSVIDMMKRQRQRGNANLGNKKARAQTPMDVDGESQHRQHGHDVDMNSFFNTTPESNEEGWIDREDVDLIEKTVEDFRLQRLSMVQSLRQFVLCYESVLEWLAEQKPKSA